MAGTERAGLAERRRSLLAGASGRVLEIGGGTGANLPLYPAAVTELTVLEPEAPMASRLRRRVHDLGRPATVVQAPAEEIPLPDASVDLAVSTLVLCTVSDQGRALAELRRVLVPGGRLLFIEHVRAADPRLARWQDRLAPLWLRFGHGCRCNRSTLAGIREAGFDVETVEEGVVPKAPPIVRPLIAGSARAPSGG
ncbi:MAG: class I SAM-dependent methyltransferase [Actinobacteria bacterium]|nr:MAG: class I SAM-dependent methyltransferase [Actinomycetota bacterium]